MSNRRKAERRAEIARLREEGAEAARAGRPVETCPQRYLRTENKTHWVRGYWTAVEQEGLAHFYP